MVLTPSDAERFWRFVAAGAPSACWRWSGATPARSDGGDRYGSFRVGDRNVGAHRVAFLLTKGQIPAGKMVRHTCDVSLCCNPAHLVLGTALDNMRDKMDRGRWRGGRRAKLSAEDRAKVLSAVRFGESPTALARKLGVAKSTVQRAVREASENTRIGHG
jgi:HNH endonuclease